MIGSEQHFRNAFGPHRAAALLAPLRRASVDARQLAAEHGFVEPRTEPTLTFDLSVKGLGDFDRIDGVRRAFSQGQHLWVIDEIYGIRVKKLGAGYKPTNHTSGQQARISSFMALDGMQPLVYLTAGARHSELTGLPEEWVIVKHYPGHTGRQAVEWVVDLEELAAGDAGAARPVLDLPVGPAAPAIRRRVPRLGAAEQS